MEHILDNPAWGALNTGNNNLAEGNGQAKYFKTGISPFAGLKENNTDGLAALYDTLPHNLPVIVIMAVEIQIPTAWKLLRYILCYQMIYEKTIIPAINPGLSIVPLTETDVPKMLALTKLTNPGPFSERTIKFGHYYGLFDGGELIAMAGQRMNALPYAEISAVCTHPDHLGRGFAKQLLLHQAERIIAAEQIPYLHVRDDNKRAISVYESTGFKTRKLLHFYVLQKN